MMQSSVEKERIEGRRKFIKSAKKYGIYFDKIKDRLPKDFKEKFDNHKWFHDFKIVSIQIVNETEETDVIILIHQEDIILNIKLSSVCKISIDIPNKNYWLPGRMTWGYTEFELLDNDIWSIRILCDINCELEFHFRKIDIN